MENHIIYLFREKRENYHGLGFCLEQGLEAMHHDMMQMWDRVKVSDLDHPDFAQRLLDFVVAYKDRHF